MKFISVYPILVIKTILNFTFKHTISLIIIILIFINANFHLNALFFPLINFLFNMIALVFILNIICLIFIVSVIYYECY